MFSSTLTVLLVALFMAGDASAEVKIASDLDRTASIFCGEDQRNMTSDAATSSIQESIANKNTRDRMEGIAADFAEIWQTFMDWIGEWVTSAKPTFVLFTPKQQAILQSTISPEEFDSWLDNQPRDGNGIPILSEDQILQLTIEVEGLAELRGNEALSSIDRSRVESTLLAKVALLEAHRFGSDGREELRELWEGHGPNGRLIDTWEAEILVSVARGEQLLFEALPLMVFGFPE